MCNCNRCQYEDYPYGDEQSARLEQDEERADYEEFDDTELAQLRFLASQCDWS
jgi:hypothetical protein